MLIFTHYDSARIGSVWHQWPFVYLHGEAEGMNYRAFNDGGSPPDICMANESLISYVPYVIENGFFKCRWQGTMSLPCKVNEHEAVCVLKGTLGLGLQGRIALVKDFPSLQHVLNVDKWM